MRSEATDDIKNIINQGKNNYLSDFLLLAVTFMGIAYNFQDDMKYCISATSAFQGHAVWHSCMAIGVGFFYLFLRQERRIEGVDEMTWKERSGSGSGGKKKMRTNL